MTTAVSDAATLEQKIKFLRAFTHQLNGKIREKREATSDQADQGVLASLESEINQF